MFNESVQIENGHAAPRQDPEILKKRVAAAMLFQAHYDFTSRLGTTDAALTSIGPDDLKANLEWVAGDVCKMCCKIMGMNHGRYVAACLAAMAERRRIEEANILTTKKRYLATLESKRVYSGG